MRTEPPLLGSDEGEPFAVERPDGGSDILLVCEHASNRVPRALGTLGLAPEILKSHIAWDPGAFPVARFMSELLDATLVSQRFSRLVIDCNRDPGSPDSMRAVSEIYDVPGNVDIPQAERQARIAEIYAPFHDRVEAELLAKRERGIAPVIVTMHSFTPVFHGWTREVELGILHDRDARLADAVLDIANRYTGMITRRNEPYGPGEGVMHTVDRHALPHGLLNLMIEVRNDLIATEDDQRRVAAELAGMIRDALDRLPEEAAQISREIS